MTPTLRRGAQPVRVSRRTLARLLVVGFPGRVPNPTSRKLAQSGVGGLVIFGGNVGSSSQLKRLIRALQAEAPVPLEIAVDQEPGRIARLGGLVDPMPTARALGQTTQASIRSAAMRLGVQLRDLGVTVDLAPVLDLSLALPNSVIGDRSFGDDPPVVARAGVVFMEGLLRSGVGSVGKHFPGHGDTVVDSHRELPVLQASKEALLARDLVPFVAAIEAGMQRIMVGHLLAPSLDPHLPTSLSRATVMLLRQELGFRGVICSDELGMAAITRSWSVAEAAEMALAAGLDQVVIKDHRHIGRVLDRLEEAVALGRLSVAAVRRSVERVARVSES